MRFEQSKFFDLLPHFKLEFSFGNYYLFDEFVIGELHEGIHFNWDKSLEVIGAFFDYYGPNRNVAYISNRVECYSNEPHLWQQFHKEFDFVMAIAVVTYSDFGYINASIEKKFTNKSLKRCNSLDEAIGWVKRLKEFNQN